MTESDRWERLDVWLWYARLAKTRSACSAAVRGGGFRLNRQSTDKPHSRLRAGDVVTFTTGDGDVRVWRVLILGTRRGPAGEARLLWEDALPGSTEPK